MTERQLRYRSGLGLIAGHFAILISIIAARLLGGFSSEETTTLLAIIAPLFSGYSTAIIAFIIRDRHTVVDKSKGVTAAYSFLALLLPPVFSAIVLATLWLEAYRKVFTSFEDFKAFLTAFESAFAVYVSLFVYSIFKPATSNQSRGPSH